MDFEEHAFFRQSDIPEVTELTWFLACLTSKGLMERAHAFKDAQSKGQDVNMGLFSYPILMAADILIYDSHVVPVGKDQKQHLEITRDLALRLNHLYGEQLVVPEGLIEDQVAVRPGLEGQKMIPSNFLSDSAFLTASVATGFLVLKRIFETFGVHFCLTK